MVRVTAAKRLLAPTAALALFVLPASCTSSGDQLVAEIAVDVIGEAVGELMGEAIEYVYETGDVSVGIGAAFVADDSLEPGLCMDIQLRGYFGDHVTWDMGYQQLQFDDRLAGGTLSADMFIMALGASSDVLLRGEAGRPFRWGAALVVAMPNYDHSGGLSPAGGGDLWGAKFRIDWLPLANWEGGWISGILEAQMLWGDTVTDESASRNWDMDYVLAVKGGLVFCW
jgi:hypothetical protein